MLPGFERPEAIDQAKAMLNGRDLEVRRASASSFGFNLRTSRAASIGGPLSFGGYRVLEAISRRCSGESLEALAAPPSRSIERDLPSR